jgi:hypothetical protein
VHPLELTTACPGQPLELTEACPGQPLEACGSDSSPRSSELAKGGVAVLLQRMEKISACPDHVAALGSLSSSSRYYLFLVDCALLEYLVLRVF